MNVEVGVSPNIWSVYDINKKHSDGMRNRCSIKWIDFDKIIF
jgi:hypothetical protein